MAKDIRLARICVASIRYWYPDIPISLVKDEAKSPFDTSEIERYWGVTIERCGQRILGGVGFLIKLEPLFLEARERILLLDSDTVFAGRVLDILERSDSQFLASPDTAHGPLDTDYGKQIVRSFLYDFNQLKELDSEIEYPTTVFNAGHLVITTGIYKKPDFSFFFDWTTKPRPTFPGLFQMGDQGFWNYLLESESYRKRISFTYAKFACYPNEQDCFTITANAISERKGVPRIIHWAGQHNHPWLSQMPKSDILLFYENFYYSNIRAFKITRFYRSIKYAIRRYASLTNYFIKASARIFGLTIKKSSLLSE